ncbi:MAG: basic amino acid ABC transporter substrate-binding protein [Anaerolineaceae bacterium]|nr:basic amino acid ABC transporter substrate-binding protein [Anaerolineaceae bacterium]MBN2676676.1 basic amino acid ABC transporter substrate-binding protein [Anaerolineaceae bacterium]
MNLIYLEEEVKKSSFVVLSALLAIAILMSACSSTGATKVRVATDATWPPFEVVDETTKELTGFDIEMVEAIAKASGLDIEFVNVGFDPLLAGMAQCQYDAAVSAITITAERAENMLFSEPYMNAGQIVTVQIDNADINSKDDLSGKTVGAQIGTTGAMEVEAIAGATLTTFDTVDLAFLALQNGQIDAVVADSPTAAGFVAQNADKLKMVGSVFTDENYGIAVCKTNTELLASINEGLAAIKADGTFDALLDKYDLVAK